MMSARKALVESRPLEDAIECSLCNEHFNNKERCPKNLTCGHHFCLVCLNKLDRFFTAFHNNRESFRIVCPVCRKHVHVDHDCDNLATNYVVLSLTENYKPHFEKELQKVNADDSSQYCECGEHFVEDNFNYCEVCDVAVCDRCAWKKHKAHAKDCHDSELFFKKLKGRVEASNERGEKILGSLHHELADTKERSSFFTEQSKSVSEAIKRHFEGIHSILNEREDEMLSVVKKHEEQYMSKVRQREQILEGEIARLQSNMSLTSEILVKDDKASLIPMRNLISDMLEKVSKFQLVEIPDLVASENLYFTPSLSSIKMARNGLFGNIHKQKAADDEKPPSSLLSLGAPVIRYDREFLLSCRNNKHCFVQPAWLCADSPCILEYGRRSLNELAPHPVRRSDREKSRPVIRKQLYLGHDFHDFTFDE